MDFKTAKNLAIEIEALVSLAAEEGSDTEKCSEIINIISLRLNDLKSLLAIGDEAAHDAVPTQEQAEEIIDDMTENAVSESAEFVEAENLGAESQADESEQIERDDISDDVPEADANTDSCDGPEPLENPSNDPVGTIIVEPVVIPPSPAPVAQNVESAPAFDINESVFRRNARDLSKAFTLNDKFRFRRELFGNSNGEFNRAVELVEVMRAPEEAEEYFYEDMGWDSTNPDVKDFMRIVTGFLSNK